jgi:hypothetical protein
VLLFPEGDGAIVAAWTAEAQIKPLIVKAKTGFAIFIGSSKINLSLI